MQANKGRRSASALIACVLFGLAGARSATPEIPPEIRTPDACATAMAQVAARPAQLRALRKLFKKHLRLRGTAHNPFPHWDAAYSDIERVHAALTPADIPAIVTLLRQGGLNGGMRAIGAGVLRMFGTQSMPCIEAALRQRGSTGYAELSGARVGIESDAAATNTNQ